MAEIVLDALYSLLELDDPFAEKSAHLGKSSPKQQNPDDEDDDHFLGAQVEETQQYRRAHGTSPYPFLVGLRVSLASCSGVDPRKAFVSSSRKMPMVSGASKPRRTLPPSQSTTVRVTQFPMMIRSPFLRHSTNIAASLLLGEQVNQQIVLERSWSSRDTGA